jgi:glucoamylase
VDQACTRDLGLIVTDGRDFFSDEKRHTHHKVEYLAEGVPAYRLTNTCTQGRFQIEKEIIACPGRDAILQRTRFTPLKGDLEGYHVYSTRCWLRALAIGAAAILPGLANTKACA